MNLKSILTLKHSAEHSDFRVYILKKNLANLIVLCSFITLTIFLGLFFTNNNKAIIDLTTILLIAYFVIVIFSIYIKIKKSNHHILFYIANFAFVFATLLWFVSIGNYLPSIHAAYYFFIMILLFFSVFVISHPLINLFIITVTSIVSIFDFIDYDVKGPYDWLIISLLYIFAIIANYYRYSNTFNIFIMTKKNDELREMLKLQTRKDSLTNLYSNKYIFEQLDYEVERANRYRFPLSVLMIDIDDFKRINENYGQLIGDDTLTIIANIIQNSCRGTDLIGRYGGEEFFVILPNTNLTDSIMIAERIRVTVDNNEFTFQESVSVSLGITTLTKQTSKDLIFETKKMLLKAKSNGKNQISY